MLTQSKEISALRTFRHSGKAGDLIYSLPTLKALGGGILYVPENTHESAGLFSNVRRLIEAQGIECREYPSNYGYQQLAPGIGIDYDLDKGRNEPLKGRTHCIDWYAKAFNVTVNKRHWLKVTPLVKGYRLISLTPRHRQNNTFDWKTVPIHNNTFFIGTYDEWKEWCKLYGYLPYWSTRDLMELAEVIAGASEVFCNQSAVLVLCQGLGIKYYCNFKHGKTNCKLYTQYENEL